MALNSIIWRGKPLVALASEVDLEVLENLASRIRANTLRRAALRGLVRFFARTGLYKTFPRAPRCAQRVLWHVEQLLSAQVNAAVLIWNHRTPMNRVYGFVQIKSEESPLVFLKYGNGSLNAGRFDTERKALNWLAATTTSFRTPTLIASRISSHESILLSTTLPPSAKVCQAVMQDLPGEVRDLSTETILIRTSEVLKCSWWREYEISASRLASEFPNIILSLLIGSPSVNLAACHGDAGSENIFVIHNEIYVIDWESFANDAPHLTDLVAYWMGLYHRDIERNPSKALSSLLAWACANCYQKTDIVLATAFLIGKQFRPAVKLAATEGWQEFDAGYARQHCV